MFGARELTKKYGKQNVLNGVNFELSAGKIVGLFGLNGSGKTTMFRILSGIDGDFKGELLKTDYEDVSYMSVENIYPIEMRIKDVLDFHKTFNPKQQTQAILEELERIGVKKNKLLNNLSTGLRQYFKFLLTVYSGTSVCLFDEPLTNLDVNLRNQIIKILISQASEDKLFIVSTHEIKEIDKIIDGFYVLKNGKLSEFFNAEDIVEQTGLSIEEFYKEQVNEKE